MLEPLVLAGGPVDLFGDAVDVVGDDVVDVDRERFAVAHAAAAHQVGDVEAIGLRGQADAAAFQGLEEALDDLVVEGVHPPAAQQRQQMDVQQRLQVHHRRRPQVPLSGLPLGGIRLEPHRSVLRDPARLRLPGGAAFFAL
ncbi:hypothetical protein AB0C68_28020 [Streptomyces tendae]|uniref:hypothetical protein n=1 Tax=Streptomyces tendae TaxID=1932 RepID=UPI00341122B8